MDKFEFKSSGKAFVKCIWSFESARMGFSRIKFSRRTKFFNTDGGNSQLFTYNLCEDIKTIATHHAEPIEKLDS